MVKKINIISVLLLSIAFSFVITFMFYNSQTKNVYFSPGGLQEKNILGFYSILSAIIFIIIFFAFIFVLVYSGKKETKEIKIRGLEE